MPKNMLPEQNDRYLALKEQIAQVDITIAECNSFVAFKSSAFYPVYEKMIQEDKDFYKYECFKGAKSELASIRNLLGRLEAIEAFHEKMLKFEDTLKSAMSQKSLLEQELEELLKEVSNPSTQSQDDPDSFS